MDKLKELCTGVDEMRSVAQRLMKWADDLEQSFQDSAPAETLVAEVPVQDVPADPPSRTDVKGLLTRLCAAGYSAQVKALMNKSIMQIRRCTSIEYERANKRWSREEDEEIIDRVYEGKMNIHQLSTIFGRSPGAIKTHISELVGRERLSVAVVGRFIGTIDGVSADSDIRGTVFK